MKFYAFKNQHGAHTTFNRSYDGELHVFEGKKDRNSWVAEDPQYRHSVKVTHDVVKQYKGKNAAGESTRAAFIHEENRVRFVPSTRDRIADYGPEPMEAETMDRLRDKLYEARFQ